MLVVDRFKLDDDPVNCSMVNIVPAGFKFSPKAESGIEDAVESRPSVVGFPILPYVLILAVPAAILKDASDPVVDPGLEPRPSGATEIPAYNPFEYESSE